MVVLGLNGFGYAASKTISWGIFGFMSDNWISNIQDKKDCLL